MQKQTFEHILSQTYNASLFLFAYFFVNAHVLSKSFHSINSLISQTSNHVLVLTLTKKNSKIFRCRVFRKNEMHGDVPVFDM